MLLEWSPKFFFLFPGFSLLPVHCSIIEHAHLMLLYVLILSFDLNFHYFNSKRTSHRHTIKTLNLVFLNSYQYIARCIYTCLLMTTQLRTFISKHIAQCQKIISPFMYFKMFYFCLDGIYYHICTRKGWACVTYTELELVHSGDIYSIQENAGWGEDITLKIKQTVS